MGLGRLSTRLVFVDGGVGCDGQGFCQGVTGTGFTCRGVFEQRSATVRWANLAGFEKVDALVRFRAQPGFVPRVGQVVVVGECSFVVSGVEDVKGRGRFLVCFLERVSHRG